MNDEGRKGIKKSLIVKRVRGRGSLSEAFYGQRRCKSKDSRAGECLVP